MEEKEGTTTNSPSQTKTERSRASISSNLASDAGAARADAIAAATMAREVANFMFVIKFETEQSFVDWVGVRLNLAFCREGGPPFIHYSLSTRMHIQLLKA